MARHLLTPLQRAARTAATQRGLLLLRQAVAAGLSDDQVERRARAEGWERIARGLYALPGSTPCWQRDALAACLLAGTGAAASFLTAAAAWSWCRPPLLPHVTVTVGNSTRTPLARIHRTRRPLAPADRARRDGIPCTSAARTLVDCAGIVERPQLECFVDDALCAGVTSVRSIEDAAERAGGLGRLGAGSLDEVVRVWGEDIKPDSPAEARLLRRLDVLGAAATTQYEVVDERGLFVARLDVAIPERRHGFEYDSDRWHNPRHWARDEPRYARLAALGWRIDPVCKLDLLPSSSRLEELLQKRAAA